MPLLLHSFVFLAIRRMRRAPCTKALINRNNHQFRRTGSENQDTPLAGDTPQTPSRIWVRRRTTSQEMARPPTFEPQVITAATTIRSMQHTAVTTNAVAANHHHHNEDSTNSASAPHEVPPQRGRSWETLFLCQDAATATPPRSRNPKKLRRKDLLPTHRRRAMIRTSPKSQRGPRSRSRPPAAPVGGHFLRSPAVRLGNRLGNRTARSNSIRFWLIVISITTGSD